MIRFERGWVETLVTATVFLVTAPVHAEEGAEDGWTGGVGASLTAQTGTTDSFVGSIDASGDRSWGKD